MDLVIVGSIAIDRIHSPEGEVAEVMGGSALYSAIAAAKFIYPGVVGVVGMDRGDEIISFLKENSVDTRGIEIRKGKTFFWEGEYFQDINNRRTLGLDLGVFAEFHPVVVDAYRRPKALFLANISPSLQLTLLDQVEAGYVVLDTMDHWIASERQLLLDGLSQVDLLIINDSEALLLSDKSNVVKAANYILSILKGDLIIKRGEHGAIFFSKEYMSFVPAYPLEEPLDPTGAGDSFAGALLGYIISRGLDMAYIPEAMLYASAVASFCVESFGPAGIAKVSLEDIRGRVEFLKKITCGYVGR